MESDAPHDIGEFDSSMDEWEDMSSFDDEETSPPEWEDPTPTPWCSPDNLQTVGELRKELFYRMKAVEILGHFERLGANPLIFESGTNLYFQVDGWLTGSLRQRERIPLSYAIELHKAIFFIKKMSPSERSDLIATFEQSSEVHKEYLDSMGFPIDSPNNSEESLTLKRLGDPNPTVGVTETIFVPVGCDNYHDLVSAMRVRVGDDRRQALTGRKFVRLSLRCLKRIITIVDDFAPGELPEQHCYSFEAVASQGKPPWVVRFINRTRPSQSVTGSMHKSAGSPGAEHREGVVQTCPPRRPPNGVGGPPAAAHPNEIR